MKNLFVRLIILLGLFTGATARANGMSNVLFYIQPYEYTNELKLAHYSQEYWYAQGPMVEPLAKEKLEKLYGNVTMCEGNQTGKMLVWLQPRMFYNSQLRVFYGKITANVYTDTGKLVGSYVGESNQLGYLGIKPDYWLKKTYTTAMNNVTTKMKADSQLQTLIDSPPTSAATNTPCSMVTLLPVPKIRAMSF